MDTPTGSPMNKASSRTIYSQESEFASYTGDSGYYGEYQTMETQVADQISVKNLEQNECVLYFKNETRRFGKVKDGVLSTFGRKPKLIRKKKVSSSIQKMSSQLSDNFDDNIDFSTCYSNSNIEMLNDIIRDKLKMVVHDPLLI